MCLLFLYINPNPMDGNYKLILVNNREESYLRPTRKATIWRETPKIIAGTDTKNNCEGGTWMGLSGNGRIGSLLNHLQPGGSAKDPSLVQTRGSLVTDYLRSPLSGQEYLNSVSNGDKDYNLFHLVVLEPNNNSEDGKISPYRLLYLNYNDKKVSNLDAGYHAFGNSAIHEPFRRVLHGKTKFTEIIDKIGLDVSNEEVLISTLFDMMQCREQIYPDDLLTSRGKGYPEEYLKNLSSIWTSVPAIKYGSRTTSVVLVDGAGRAVFRERTLKEPIDLDNPQWENSSYVINLSK